MNSLPTSVPVVMCFSGLDATGGAGLQADIETIASMGCHASPVMTANTVQTTGGVIRYQPAPIDMLIEQARAVLEDMPVSAFKVGMLGSVEIVEAVHSIVADYPDIPLVLDPVLTGGGGGSLSSDDTLNAIKSLMLEQTTILTPNSIEARALAPEADTLDACAHELLDDGCGFVLITGTHEPGEHVENRLYGNHRLLEVFSWERLPHSYHGSGCTLAAGIAGLLAQGLEPFIAAHEAQEFAWESLKNGFLPGMGQYLPNRLFWARDEESQDYDQTTLQ